jgi:hypothetical protein
MRFGLCCWGCFLVVLVGFKGEGGGFALVVLGFCGSLFSFCFLFLGVPFVYYLCT